MTLSAATPCRTYIVYHNGLFAQGIRSVLAQESGVQIVGMENNVARAVRAVRTLRPEVILMEEPLESGAAWPFLEWASASRIVTFSLNHAQATVYSPHRTAAGDPVDLVKAIQGGREWEQPRVARSDSKDASTSPVGRLTAGEGSHSDGIDPVPQSGASRTEKKDSDPVGQRKHDTERSCE